jgi:ParB family chromosome partitioning protein
MSDKKIKERGLGRGLSALMSDVGVSGVVGDFSGVEDKKNQGNKLKKNPLSKSGVTTIGINQLIRNPDQPRRYFDKEKLKELTDSIKDKGVLQPILVRPISKSDRNNEDLYQIVAGERRWQASLTAKLDAMPVLIRDLTDQEVLEIGVVENVQRADLNPIEEALAYKALSEQFSRTQQEIATSVGKSRPHIANMLRLLSLPPIAQDYLAKGSISTGHARAIIAAPDPTELADAIVNKGLSVREAEDWVRRIKAGDGKTSVPAQKDANVRKVENDLSDYIGLIVNLRHKGPGGELRIKYKTAEQLEGLIKRLKP